jgi:hypothetical protein
LAAFGAQEQALLVALHSVLRLATPPLPTLVAEVVEVVSRAKDRRMAGRQDLLVNTGRRQYSHTSVRIRCTIRKRSTNVGIATIRSVAAHRGI